MHDVYILLTRSTTYFSRLIQFVTSDKYTHASIGFSGETGIFYSFGRKNEKLMLPAGFVAEKISNKQIYSGPTYYSLYKIQVTDSAYHKIKEYIKYFGRHDELYEYNILGVMALFFGIKLKRRHHMYCSQFVAKCLANESEIGRYIEDTDRIKPEDFVNIPNLQLISCGYIGGLHKVELGSD